MDAAASLLKFIEVVAPDTVPARHHRLLLSKLEAVERGEIPRQAQSIRGRMAMGKVYLPRHALWANELVAELLRFPAGANDDQVDTLGLFGRMLDLRGRLLHHRQEGRLRPEGEGQGQFPKVMPATDALNISNRS
jgi:hypothetical protein